MVPDKRLFLCTDLDRTLLPNGHVPEPSGARELFRALVSHPAVTLAYVSGRNQPQMREAIADWNLPAPKWAICDVGATIFRVTGETWHPWTAWNDAIASDWRGMDSWQVAPLLQGIEGLRKQPETQQNRHKLSYYADPESDSARLRAAVLARLVPHGVRATVIWSIEELENIGMLDVLPAGASKLHAIQFVRAHLGFTPEETLFAGDSGNDLEALCGPLPAVLVANARPEVRAEATRRIQNASHPTALFFAGRGIRGLGGDYAAGILEGVMHHHPHAATWF
ncbi:MAG: HAD-IIB family hydrolase [Magnetococcales bacterium]|nr:HAD-IIB family hydrolase [Magnetococcales bacterium]